MWDKVQSKMAKAVGSRRERGNSQHVSLLTGMIRDHADRPMSPSHAVRLKRRYRYYASSTASAVDGTPIKAPALRLPAAELERTAIDAIAAVIADQQIILSLPQADALLLRQQLEAGERLASQLKQAGKAHLRQMLLTLGLVIIVQPERIDASISRRRLIAILEGRQPPLLTARALMKHPGIPLDWKSQRRALGF